MTDLTISVRGLVEFLLRSGDLDNRSGKNSEEAMLAGSRMHRKLQDAAEGDYEPEVPLSTVWQYGGENGLTVEVEGRADGIYYGTNPGETEPVWTIDEIKTTYRRLQSIRNPEPVHLAQAKCYAYIYAVQNDLDRICVRMTYCNLMTEGIRHFYEVDTREEIIQWFSDLMEQYRPWAEHMISWSQRRTASIHDLQFPYPWRPGQKDLAAAVYRTILHGKKLFLEAPTGTGKTLATLFPAIKAVGEGKSSRIFYLTAKTITRQAAENTLRLLRGHGLLFKSVVLTAKEKVCILEKPDCNPDSCPRAVGHFDRVNEAIYDLIIHEDDFSRENVQNYAEKYQVCPFELSLDLSLFSDAVIGDYNYLFDPHAYLRRFFGEGGTTDSIFLVDEAHNLVERGRSMYSASIVREDVIEFHRKIKDIWPSLAKKLNRCSRIMLNMQKSAEIPALPDRNGANPSEDNSLESETASLRSSMGSETASQGRRSSGGPHYKLADADQLAGAVSDVDQELSTILGEERIAEQTGKAKRDPLRKKKKEAWDDLLNFYFNIDHFAMMYADMGDDYVVYQETVQSKFVVKLFCVNPARKLSMCMKRGRSTVLFSATLLPITYYKTLLGGTAEDYEIYAESVFDPERQGLFLVRDLTSRYRDRTPQTFERIADCIWRTVSERNGNYMVFFPSYSFLNAVGDVLEGKYPHCAVGRQDVTGDSGKNADSPAGKNDIKKIEERGSETQTIFLRQVPGMKEKDREEFLGQFESARDDTTLVGLCVLGGIFSEGIDLRNDRLIGVVIVGTGIPQVGSERELLKDYFDGHGVNGYDYAYRFPGMNKVQQAAGRVIRTQDDVGLVVLLDERFVTPAYRRLFPREWQHAVITDSHNIGREAEKFWNEWL